MNVAHRLADDAASVDAGASAATIDVSVILVSFNTADLIDRCLDRLAAASNGLRLQVLIVDNASVDRSVERLRARGEGCELVENKTNVGFGRANNQVLERVRGRYVLLLNIDAFVEEDTLRSTVRYMDANPRCGVLGVRLVDADGALQPSCRYFPTPWNGFLQRTGLHRLFSGTRLVDDMAWDHDRVRSCDWVPGCYYLVRADLIETLGLFDPRYFVYFEEVDHCRRVKAAGWDVTYFPDATVTHIGGESAKSAGALTAARQLSPLQVESELLYFRKHHGVVGVCTATVLSIAGDLVVALKSLLKLRPFATVRHVGAAGLRNTILYVATFWRTAAGTRATR